MQLAKLPVSRIVAILGLVCAFGFSPRMAYADQACDAVMNALTGQRPDGQGTPDLEHKARLGDCTAAAKLVRRGRDAAGYAKLHCSSQVQSQAASVLEIGQDTLDTSDCQG